MIRLAEPKDANQAMDLVMIVLEDMELNVFNQLPKTKIKELLIQGFIEKPTYRYGFQNAIIKEINNEVVGVAFGYPDSLEKTIDQDFIDLLAENDLPESYKLFDEEETFEDEWYLDTLVTSPNHRGKGIAKELLEALPLIAKEKNCASIGLNVDQINHHAKKLYLNNGFEKVGEMLIANHQYDHLQKQVS